MKTLQEPAINDVENVPPVNDLKGDESYTAPDDNKAIEGVEAKVMPKRKYRNRRNYKRSSAGNLNKDTSKENSEQPPIT